MDEDDMFRAECGCLQNPENALKWRARCEEKEREEREKDRKRTVACTNCAYQSVHLYGAPKILGRRHDNCGGWIVWKTEMEMDTE